MKDLLSRLTRTARKVVEQDPRSDQKPDYEVTPGRWTLTLNLTYLLLGERSVRCGIVRLQPGCQHTNCAGDASSHLGFVAHAANVSSGLG